jgi:Flp pilus assembly protein TadB
MIKKKRFFIEFVIYGLPFSLLMWVMNQDKFSIGRFFFHFIFYGGVMALLMGYLEKRRLRKEGLNLGKETKLEDVDNRV